MDKATAIVKLTRIEHSIMLVIAVIAAEAISGKFPSIPIFILSMITPVFVSMGSFAINDYYDIRADKANKRFDRPLVNGSLTRKEAMWITVVCMAIGVLASAFINAYAFAIALVFAALAILYSYRMKDILLLGNVYIAFSMVIPFIYGSYVVSTHVGTAIILVSITIFLAGLAREVHGMIRDQRGDRERKSRNLLYHISRERASQFAAVLYIEAILVSVYMFFFTAPFRFNLVYMVPIAVTDIALVYITYGFIVQKRSDEFYRLSRNLSLAVMGLALLAFLAAALVHIAI